MGRELKRISLDFEWPLDKTWKGYLNPHRDPCKSCGGGGYSRAGVIFDHNMRDLVSSILIEGNERSYRSTYYQIPEKQPDDWDLELKNLIEKATGKDLRSPILDSTQMAWELQKLIFEAAGIDPDDFGECSACSGEGVNPESLEAYNNWLPYEPPEGTGWQIWQTVGEGSPITPIFETAEELINHVSTVGTCWGKVWSKEAAENFVKGYGYAPSLIIRNGKAGPGYEMLVPDTKETCKE